MPASPWKLRSGPAVSYFNTYAMSQLQRVLPQCGRSTPGISTRRTRIELQFLDRNGRVDNFQLGVRPWASPRRPRRCAGPWIPEESRFLHRAGPPYQGDVSWPSSAPLEYRRRRGWRLCAMVTSTRELDQQVALLAVAVIGPSAAVISWRGADACNLLFMRRHRRPGGGGDRGRQAHFRWQLRHPDPQ